MTARVTVIVINHNGLAHLEECLRTVAAQDLAEPFEVLLWDNASGDGSVAWVKANHPGVQVHACPENLGFAAAANQAIRMAASPLVVLLNNDVRVPPDWLRPLVAAIDDAPADVLSVGSRMLLHHAPDRINHAGAVIAAIGGGWDVGLMDPIALHERGPRAYETGASSGGAAVYRRDLFLALGGFDDSFFLYFEDVDLCYRAWVQGYRILHAPTSIVYHKLGGTVGGQDSPFRLYWGPRNRIRMACKDYQAWTLVRCLPLLAAVTLLPLLRQVRRRDWMSAKIWSAGTLRGLWDGLLLLGSRQRRLLVRQRSDRELQARGLMVGYRGMLAEKRRLAHLPTWSDKPHAPGLSNVPGAKRPAPTSSDRSGG